jgi:REP element-mobilizing transposase RayT
VSRPLRIEFPGACYHVTSRGDRQETIYEDNLDRLKFLDVLEEVITSYNWLCHAYCLMGNHYHLVVQTPDGNLSKGMRQLNGVYTQLSNRRHERVGHLFQGRYQGILVDEKAYLLELGRYVVLNPVRAGLVNHPAQWAWSSYRAMMDPARKPEWLSTGPLLSHFSKHRPEAVQKYQRFVAQGSGEGTIWDHLNRQIYLGDDEFVDRILSASEKSQEALDVPKIQQRRPAPSLETFTSDYPARNDAIVAAYATGQYSYHQIAMHFGLHYTSVGKIVRKSRGLASAKGGVT